MTPTTFLPTLVVLAFAAPQAPALQCTGVDTNWTPTTGGTYALENPLYWDQGVPGATDRAFFNGQGSTSILVTGPRTICGAFWLDGDWTFTGAPLTTVPLPNYQSAGMHVPYGAGVANLTLDGIVVEAGSTTRIALSAGATGKLRVTGLGSLLRHTPLASEGYFQIGGRGQGALVIDNGGAVFSEGATFVGDFFSGSGGSIEVLGTGSSFDGRFVNIGHRSFGDLLVEGGGLFRSRGSFWAGVWSNDTEWGIGTVTVRDPGSRLELQTFVGWTAIGRFGEADMLVENGGQVVSGIRDVNLAEQQGSRGELIVQGAGSSWVMNNPTQGFFVGRQGTGVATILSGATMNAPGNTWIGYKGVAKGSLIVSGQGSLFSGNVLAVGRDQLVEPLVRGDFEVSNGAIAQVTSKISVHGEGSVQLQRGTLDCPLVDLLDGTLSGSGTITGELRNKGRLRPGDGAAALSIQGIGGYTQFPEGTLEIQIAGTTAGSEYGQLKVSTAAWISGGTLDVRFVNGFVPALGDSFEVMTYLSGGLLGSFSEVTTQGLPAYLTLVPNYGTDRLELVVEELATAYCFCSSQAPCGNTDANAGCVNGSGSGGLLSASGSRIVANDDLVLQASGLPPQQLGLVFMGSAQMQIPFRNGQLCVGAGTTGIYRFSISNSGSSGVLQNGPGLIEYSATHFPGSGQITAGQIWNFQAWYRDSSGPCGQGSNLTNALEVMFVL